MHQRYEENRSKDYHTYQANHGWKRGPLASTRPKTQMDVKGSHDRHTDVAGGWISRELHCTLKGTGSVAQEPCLYA